MYKKLLAVGLSMMMVSAGFVSYASEDLAANVNPTYETEDSTSYKTDIEIAMTGDLPSSSPYGNSSTQTFITTNSTFNGLVDMDKEGNASEALATSWESNEDSTVWTFTLREGVKFHDGSDFTAQDVAWTWDYASTTENDGINWPLQGANLIDSIEVVDDYTVVFNLNTSSPDFLFYAAQKIMSQNAVETLGFSEGGSIGTGPYIFDSQETGVSWTIRRNDNYWGTPGISETITFQVVTDASTRALTLQSGDVDAIFEANSSDIVSFLEDDSYNVFQAENSANVYLGFNCSTENGGNNIIRQAVAMAINRDDIVNACYEGGICGTASFNVINNVTTGYKDVEYVEYDPEGAMELLAENGLENITLRLTTFSKYLSVAEVVQAELSMIGINVEIRELAQASFTANLTAEPDAYDMYINATSSQGGILNIMERFFENGGASAAMFYHNDEFDSLISEVRGKSTYDELIEGFGELQDFIAKDVPAIALVQTYLWCIGTNNFYGVDLGAQTYDVDFSYCYVVEE